MDLREAYKEFILQKRLMGLSDATIKDYENIIGIFLDYIGYSLKLEKLTLKRVNGFILDLYDRPLSKSTVATYIRNMRIFLRWTQTEYNCFSFDPAKIQVPKSPKKIVHIYTVDEIKLLFSSCEVQIPWISARDKAILALMLDSGLRQSEVCNLLFSGLDRERMIVKVTGKGAKDRLVPIGYASLALIDDYLFQCPYKDSKYVFLGRNGSVITCNAVRIFVNRLEKKLPFELTSHKLRHNYATNYCIDNILRTGNSNVFDLSILMGHESIETTKRYEHFAHQMIAVENRSSHLDSCVYGI